jgi:hypothetical protein
LTRSVTGELQRVAHSEVLTAALTLPSWIAKYERQLTATETEQIST